MKLALCAACALLIAAPATSLAQEAGRSGLSWDAVVDTYFAWDFNRPDGGARAFATQPSRHNEFALNLALVRVQYSSSESATPARASIGIATGTYMEANYAAEPQLFRNIYEAYAGVGLGRGTWLDAGILPSHIGFESALTPANRSWSRSLIAENSPYYEAGVRLTLQPTHQLTVALLALNGWQNIRETNDGKAAGLQLAYRPTARLLLNYSNYIGDEAPSGSDDAAIRFFHDIYAQLAVSDRVGITAAFDSGSQQRADGDAAVWHGSALLAHVQIAPRWTVCGRAEYYHDPDQAIVNTGTEAGLVATGGSLTLDYAPAERVLLRTEGRVFGTDRRVWPSRDGLENRDAFLVTSLAITF